MGLERTRSHFAKDSLNSLKWCIYWCVMWDGGGEGFAWFDGFAIFCIPGKCLSLDYVYFYNELETSATQHSDFSKINFFRSIYTSSKLFYFKEFIFHNVHYTCDNFWQATTCGIYSYTGGIFKMHSKSLLHGTVTFLKLIFFDLFITYSIYTNNYYFSTYS